MHRRDATLREVLTTLRLAAPQSAEFRHPLARYSFKALYADSAKRGQITPRELGTVYSRDILGEPGSNEAPALRLLEDYDGEKREITEREKEERTLEELLFYPGDYLCVSVVLPKGAAVAGELSIKGSAASAPGASNGWRSGPSARDGPWGFGASATSPIGRGSGGHWRGGSDAPVGRGRGGGRFGAGGDRGRDFDDRDRNRDRRVPPPRGGRDSPPRRGGYGRDRRSRSRSRSRGRDYSPPRRRDSRY